MSGGTVLVCSFSLLVGGRRFECDPALASGAQTTMQTDYVVRIETAKLANQTIVTNDRQP